MHESVEIGSICALVRKREENCTALSRMSVVSASAMSERSLYLSSPARIICCFWGGHEHDQQIHYACGYMSKLQPPLNMECASTDLIFR